MATFLLPSSALVDTSVVERPLADSSGAAVLDEVLFPLAAIATTVD